MTILLSILGRLEITKVSVLICVLRVLLFCFVVESLDALSRILSGVDFGFGLDRVVNRAPLISITCRCCRL